MGTHVHVLLVTLDQLVLTISTNAMPISLS